MRLEVVILKLSRTRGQDSVSTGFYAPARDRGRRAIIGRRWAIAALQAKLSQPSSRGPKGPSLGALVRSTPTPDR